MIRWYDGLIGFFVGVLISVALLATFAAEEIDWPGFLSLYGSFMALLIFTTVNTNLLNAQKYNKMMKYYDQELANLRGRLSYQKKQEAENLKN